MSSDIEFRTIESAPTLFLALSRLKDQLMSYHIRDLAYGYMVNPNSPDQHDVAMVTTLSDKLMSFYGKHGGLEFDPVADQVGGALEPFSVDLEALVNGSGAKKFIAHPPMRAFLRADYSLFWSFPFSDEETLGYGALTLHLLPGVRLEDADTDELMQIANRFHREMKRGGQLGLLFDLSELETETLRVCATGQPAKQIAAAQDVSVRAIEMRLEACRVKLKARNTMEAIFKATVYGILNNPG